MVEVTVLLGAGASVPFDIPDSKKIVIEIEKNLVNYTDDFKTDVLKRCFPIKKAKS